MEPGAPKRVSGAGTTADWPARADCGGPCSGARVNECSVVAFECRAI